MVPNFALDLSEDGIVLLHRAGQDAAWTLLREVRLDDPDLSAKLHDLSELAKGLSGGSFYTKLILPPSQLLYSRVPVGHDIHGDVERALEARTPYSITDLAYDIRGTAPEVQVVAVARETLREAEEFIAPYGLNAIGFTARPEAEHFSGEPNLGMTALGDRVGFVTELTPVPSSESLRPAKPEPEQALSPDPSADATTLTNAPEETELSSDSAAKPSDDATAEGNPSIPPAPDPAPSTSAETTPIVPPSETPASDAPAAFSSRRRGGEETSQDAGDRLTKLTARIAIPSTAPKLGGASTKVPKPPKAKKPLPKVTAKSVAKETLKDPPIVPVAPPSVTQDVPAQSSDAAIEPAAASPSGPTASQKTTAALKSAGASLSGVAAAAREKRAARKAAKAAVPPKAARPKTPKPKADLKPAPTPQPDSTAALSSRDPIAELAARQASERPRRLGLILTLVLLVALGLFAALSSYLLPEELAARLFGRSVETVQSTTPALPNQEETEAQADADLTADEGRDLELAALPTNPLESGFEQPDFDQPQFDTGPQVVIPTPEATMTLDDAETAYAVSGIWQKSPEMTTDVTPQTLNDLFLASLDPNPAFEDAPALPPTRSGDTTGFADPGPPPPPGLRFNLDARGLVVPTPDGAINPDGIRVFLGQPPVAAIPRSDRNAPRPVEPVPDDRLAAFRPVQRPDNLTDLRERATLGGRSRSELADIRPQQRPESAQAQAEAIARAVAEAENDTAAEVEEALSAATRLAVATSRKPASRPGNFSRIVAAVREAQESAPAVQTASASTASAARATGPAVSRSSRASPTGPTRASVARAATDNNALALGKVALVGVFGTSSNRRALVRMPNGRFKKVSVGDRVDGGRVAAIGSSELRYTKGGRTVTLKMPKG